MNNESNATVNKVSLPTISARGLRAVLATGSRPYLHIDRDLNAPVWGREKAFATLSVKREKTRDLPEVVTRLEGIPAFIRGGYTDAIETHEYQGRTFEKYSTAYEPRKGYWSLWACDTFDNVLAMLPDAAEISFTVGLDRLTSETLTNKRLHGDVLILQAKWTARGKKVEREFVVDMAIGGHTSARFGNGCGEC